MYRFFIKTVKIEDTKPTIEAVEIARYDNAHHTEVINVGDIIHLTKDMMLEGYDPAPVKVLNREISFKTVFDPYIRYKNDVVINDVLLDVDCEVNSKSVQLTKDGNIIDVELPTLLDLITPKEEES